MSKITFGSDPEFMLVDQKGSLRSAIGIVPGKKDARYDLGDGHKAYYDNVLCEVQIAPAKTAKQAVTNFGECLRRCARLVKPYKLVPRASATFPASECVHDDAKVFGCDPEYDAYDLVVCKPPNCEEGNTFRSGGGHIHIGFAEGAEHEGLDSDKLNVVVWNRIWVVRMCDLFLGIPALLTDHDPTSQERRKLYGGAGTHRIPPYGVEYRSLSNFWLAHPDRVALMFDLANHVVDIVVEQKTHQKIWEQEISPADLRSTINSGDKEKANAFFSVFKKHTPKDLVARVEEFFTPRKVEFYKDWKLA